MFQRFSRHRLTGRQGRWLLGRVADCSVVLLVLVCVAGALELGLWLTGLGSEMFYRPTEMLRVGDPEYGQVYQPRQQLTMLSPFSDLQATHRVGIIEPREIEFVTDSLGFRNRKDYAGQALFLVGDSFAMGEGATQSCVITEVLKDTYQLDLYNLAHSGNQPHDYLKHLESFTRARQPSPKAVVMFFEGNDFEPFEPQHYAHNVLQPYQEFFKRSNLYRYTRWLYLRATAPKDTGEGPLLRTLNGEPVAFSSWYTGNVLRSEPLQDQYLQFSQIFEAFAQQLALVVFVPDKYRVYAPLLDQQSDESLAPLPNRAWEYLEALATKYQVPSLNLYPALEQAASQALKTGEYVYWRGDTHWNCLGMRVAAQALSEALGSIVDRGSLTVSGR